jgi:hypothetical protein
MTRLARENGFRPRRLRFDPPRLRSLEAFARENVVEGCVGESIGASIALHQAERCADAGLRETMSAIARDELRHAALAFRVHAWVVGCLDPVSRGRVRAAAATAIERARARPPLADSPHAEALGLPHGHTVSAVVDALAPLVLGGP